MILIVFQAHNVSASCSTAGDFNHALASCGSQATASGSTGSNLPGNAIDGVSSSYWQSSSTTGWLAVQFQTLAYVNVVKAHFTTSKYSSLSVYLDTNGNGVYETSEKLWSTTSNSALDVVASLPSVYFALGIKITIDLKNGTNNPKINEFEAFLQGDSDGDGLTNGQEASTTYYQDMSPGGLPQKIPDDGVNASSASVALAAFYGLPVRALANFTVNHTKRTDLTASIGYWNGSAWVDRYVWDPGKRLLAIGITQPDAVSTYAGTITAVATVLHPEITTKVEFRVNGSVTATVMSPVGNEFRWNWATSGDGPRVLNVTQFDSAGARAWDQHTVSVNNLGPSTTWKNPTNGATVTDRITLKASATDYYGINRVEFYAHAVDGFPEGSATVPNPGTNDYTWTWDPCCVGSGTHTLTALSYDNNNALRKSTSVAISVTVATDPQVAITAPTNGQTISGDFIVTSSASSASSTISKVEYYVDNALKASPTTSPYSWRWPTAQYSNGQHLLAAIAYRSSDGKTATNSITVTTSNGGGGGGCPPNCPTLPSPEQPDAPSPPSARLGTLISDWVSGETDAGAFLTVVVDLTGSPTGGTPAENASRILRPGLATSLFVGYLQWRLVIRDWSRSAAGNVTTFTLRFEVKSDPNNPDTDGDGIPDGVEVNKWHTLPVTRDSDLDGLSDDYEITPHSLTVSVNGVTTIVPQFTTDPANADSDGDGLSDGQERGFVSFGITKVVGEVGIAKNIAPSGWTPIYLRNRYTSPVVIAEPSTFRDKAFSHVRISGVTDHMFQAKIEKWTSGGSGAGEDVTYLVLEAGDHVLPDGTFVEAGTATVATGGSTVTFRESFASAPIVLIQPQTVSTANALVAKRTNSFSGVSFGAYLNTNGTTVTTSETVGYIAISPQATPSALATWTRSEVYVTGQTGTWTFPSNFTSGPLILAWFKGEDANGNKNIGLRLSSSTNHSATVYREQSGTAPADTIGFFAFAGPMNLTARLTTKPTVLDTDGDTLPDGTEVNSYSSNPTLRDSDADGIADNIEVTPRTTSIPVNGAVRNITYTTSPTSPDTDADGVPDLQELQGVLDHRVLYYDMATLTSGSVIRDLSGNGAEGNVKYVQTSTTGKVGGSILFNGTTGTSANRIQIPSSPWLNLTDGFTIMAWVDPTTTSQITGSAIFAKGYGNSASIVVDIVPSGSNQVFRAYVNSASYKVTSSTAISANTWYLVTAVYDAVRGTLSLYVNGNAPATISGVPAIATNTHDLTIGSREWSTSSGYNMSFRGYIDEVQAWDRPISRAEVNATYNVTSSTSFLARLDFDTLTASGKLFDFAGGSHPGAINGTTVVDGRTGLARSLGRTDGIYLAGSSTISITSAVTLDITVYLSAYPSTDASIVARRGSFYLNVSSDGLVRWSAYKVASVASPLPIALGRWVRITATATGSALNLYLEGSAVASWSGSAAFQGTSTAVTLGYADGQTHLAVALDEFTVLGAAASGGTITDSGAHGIQLNPNSTDTDGDGLADGKESYTYTAKTASRYPIPDGSSKTSDSIALSLGTPGWAIDKAMAMVGVTHPNMGQVSDNLYFQSGSKTLQSFTLKTAGSNAGQSNNFTSYDLFQLGLSRSALVATLANSYLIASDNSVDGKKGQLEYVQLQFNVLLLPNRADTDRDGLNDSEEANLGSDGFRTNPWLPDTDSDGISDGLETGGWSWSGSTIIPNPQGFHTDPTLNDTDRDGVPDNRDLAPLGNAFVEVRIDSTFVSGSDGHNANNMPLPFVAATIQGNTTYTSHLDSRSGTWYTIDYVTLNSYLGHKFSANVPDDVSQVSIALQMWSFDSRTNPAYNQQTSIAVSSHYVQTTCVNDYTATLWYTLQAPGQSTTYQLRGCSPPNNAPLYAAPLNVTITTFVPDRVTADLVVPADYSGVYNVTNSSGGVVGRRYVGEPRFVAIMLNATTYDPAFHCYCGPPVTMSFLVPRSVFFDTEFYKKLNASNPTSPLDKLSFRQNDTGATSNSDSLQAVLTGNVTMGDWVSILFLLEYNATNVQVRTALRLTNDLFFYSLPDGAIRFVGYQPPLTAPSWTYTFCTGQCGPPTPKPWWEQVWNGFVSVVVSIVVSAIVIAVTAFKMVVQVLSQVGSWIWNNLVGPGIQVVTNAVRAAAKVLGQLLDSFFALFTAPVKAVLAYLDGWKADIVQAARYLDQVARSFDGSPTSVLQLGAGVLQLLGAVFRPDIILLLTVMSFAIIAAATAAIATGIGYLVVSQVVPIIVSLIVSVIVQAFVPAASSALAWLANMVDTRQWRFLGVAIAGFDVAVSFLARFGAPMRPLIVERVLDPNVPEAFRTSYGETINPVKTSRALILAILGFVLAAIPTLVALSATVSLILDLISLGLGIWAFAEAMEDPARVLFGKLTSVISGVEAAFAAFGVLGHIDGAARGE